MNVLKNFVNKTYLTIASLVFFSSDAFCVSESNKNQAFSASNPEGLLSMILALLFVVFVIFAIAWVAKRFNLTPASSSHLKMVSSSSLGGRERIVVIEVQGEQHAIGVTQQSVNHLFKLEKNIETAKVQVTDNQLVNKINKLFGYQAPQASESPNSTSTSPKTKD